MESVNEGVFEFFLIDVRLIHLSVMETWKLLKQQQQQQQKHYHHHHHQQQQLVI